MEVFLASIPTAVWVIIGIVTFLLLTWASIAISMWLSYRRWLKGVRG